MKAVIAAILPMFLMGQAAPPAVDPLTASPEVSDVERFARLFRDTGGRPTAEQLQTRYLDPGTHGVTVFTPDRIRNARHLAEAVAKRPERYARAIETCLPVVKDTAAELRATYLAFKGLFPDKPLPRIYVVMGAGNSGGTAGPGAQVLGLEVLCDVAGTPDRLREIVRGFYAHETVHTWQGDLDPSKLGGILAGSILIEGAADFIANLATGRQMDPARAAWAAPREAELWRRLEADLAATRDAKWTDLKPNTPVDTSFKRWIGNYSSAPAGWPSEVGYWMGQRIWERWYDRQPDKRAALRQMLSPSDPAAVFAQGRFVAPAVPRGAK